MSEEQKTTIRAGLDPEVMHKLYGKRVEEEEAKTAFRARTEPELMKASMGEDPSYGCEHGVPYTATQLLEDREFYLAEITQRLTESNKILAGQIWAPNTPFYKALGLPDPPPLTRWQKFKLTYAWPVKRYFLNLWDAICGRTYDY